MRRFDPRELLTPLPALGWLAAGMAASRGFVGGDTWAALRCPAGWRAFADATCTSPLGSALTAAFRHPEDPLPAATAIGHVGGVIAVLASVPAARRLGASRLGAAVAGLLLAAWPGLAPWAAGSPSFGPAVALSALGTLAMTFPRGPALGGALWFAAMLARPEAVALPFGAFLILATNRQFAPAARMLLGFCVPAVLFAAARLAYSGAPIVPAPAVEAAVAPWVLTLLPPILVGLVSEVHDRVSRWPRWRIVAFLGAILLVDAAVTRAVLPSMTGALAAARIDAEAGKWLTRHAGPGERVRGAIDAVAFYAPDLDFGADGDWAVTHGPSPAGYGAVKTFLRGPTVSRRGAPPPPVYDRAPEGLGPPVRLRDGTTFVGGVLPARAFAGEGLTVDTWFDPSGPGSSSTRVEIELWASGGSTPVLRSEHVPGDGLWPGDRWDAGQHVRDHVRVDVPADLPPGRYYVIWRLRVDGEIVAAPPFYSGRIQVGTVAVSPPRSGVWIPATRPGLRREPAPPPIQTAAGVRIAVGGLATGRVTPPRAALSWVSATGPVDGVGVATVATLLDPGVLAAGAGPTAREACDPVVVAAEKLKVAVFGVDATDPEHAAAASRAGPCYVDPGRLSAWEGRFRGAFTAAHAERALVLVGVRWSAAGSNWPDTATRRLAATLVRSGADVVVGTGAGRLQGIELVDGRPVLYDVGALTSHDDGEGSRSAWFTLIAGPDGVAQLRATAVDATPDGPTRSGSNTRANTLRRIRDLSAVLGTRVVLTTDEAVIDVPKR